MTLPWRRSDPSLEEARQRIREAQQRKPEAGQRIPERYQRKTLPRIGPFQWVTTIRGKNPLSSGPLLLAPLLEAARSATGPLYPWFLIIARKSRALMALCCWSGWCSRALPSWRTAPSAASWPGLPGHPRRRRRKSRAVHRCAGPSSTGPACHAPMARRCGTRSCGGPAWMAGTSPAMTARVPRLTTDNAIRAKSRALIVDALGLRGWPGQARP